MRYFLLIIILLIIVCCGILWDGGCERNKRCQTIYVIRAHVMDDQLRDMWDKMTKELGEDCVYLLFDNTKNVMTHDFMATNKDRVILMTEQLARIINPLHKSNWANGDATLGILYRTFEHKPFENLWLIESDVYCDGSWKVVFDQVKHMPHDFLATFVEDHNEQNDDWIHWDELYNYNIPRTSQAKCFFPVGRFSKSFLEFVHVHLGKHSGYWEVYIPTLARNNGFTYANVPDQVIGEFHYAKVTVPYLDDNRLYHKVIL